MPYELPPLPYDYDALEPTIDEQTMRIHHGKHHQAYVDNLNKALDGTEWDGRPLEQVLALLDELPDDKQAAVRNNGGGHANHSLFWQIMRPGGGGEPSGALADAIANTFGDADQLKAAMNDAGVKRFGSGWSWLIWDGTGLAVVSTPNQDSPLITSDVPLLGIDVWEHAYYLKYQNRRPDYLAAWWDVVNWESWLQGVPTATCGTQKAPERSSPGRRVSSAASIWSSRLRERALLRSSSPTSPKPTGTLPSTSRRRGRSCSRRPRRRR